MNPQHFLARTVLACVATATAAASVAAPGDVVVPAHRARDGTLVPANVPPSSGGTYLPRVEERVGAKVPRPVGRSRPAAVPVPMFVAADPIRR